MYWIAATILLCLNALSLVANLFLLPGNWFMVGTLCLFILGVGSGSGGPDWTTVLVVVGLAVLGEVLEMFTGTAVASKKGASRRAMILSLVVSFIGAIAGSFVIPIPVIGGAIGAIAGAAVGAFSGAWLGEAWKGSEAGQRTEIGKAAMGGRMIGMLAKVGVGAAIFILQLISLWA